MRLSVKLLLKILMKLFGEDVCKAVLQSCLAELFVKLFGEDVREAVL